MLVTSLDIPEANTKGTISGTDSCTSVGASFLGLFSLLNPLIMCVRFVRSILRHYFRRPETTEILFKKLEEKGKAKSPLRWALSKSNLPAFLSLVWNFVKVSSISEWRSKYFHTATNFQEEFKIEFTENWKKGLKIINLRQNFSSFNFRRKIVKAVKGTVSIFISLLIITWIDPWKHHFHKPEFSVFNSESPKAVSPPNKKLEKVFHSKIFVKILSDSIRS